MGRTIIIYKTKYGSSKKYAQWLKEELNADIMECSNTAFSDIEVYDIIIYCGSLYAVGILGFNIFKKNFYRFSDKKIIIFTVGASPARPEALVDIADSNFTAEMENKIEHYHLRGSFDFNKLNLIDKILMLLLKFKIKHKNQNHLTNDEIGMLASYDKPYDWTNRKQIMNLVEHIKNDD